MPVPGFKKPKRHAIQSRTAEIIVALVFLGVATYLMYDAFDWRNKDMPWPLSGLFWG